jgi:DHA1 family bicyclomycin/chloramphenicol resistance-like MFS transporter
MSGAGPPAPAVAPPPEAGPAGAPVGPSRGEFVALVALLTSLVALSIDSMLPALGAIGRDLGAVDENDRQSVLFAFFAGLGAGQLLFGPLSDRIGRRPAIIVGLAIFTAGALACLAAGSFAAMVAGRVVMGFGAAGPRIASIAMVRDGQSGAAMARTMSLVMTVFILVPIFAPALGQAVLWVAHWRAIFGGLLVVAVAAGAWLWLRQPETLPPARRHPVTVRGLADAAYRVLAHRSTLAYTLAGGLMFGVMIAYLATSQQVFVEQYGLGDAFAAVFALVAVAIGAASALNARLVMRWGMLRLTRLALRAFTALSIAFLAACVAVGGHPPLVAYLGYLLTAFFCLGIVFGNVNALAMEPMGAVAGMAASVIGTLTALIAVTMGALVGRHYDGTLTPLVAGFALIGVAAVAAIEAAAFRRSS